MTLDRRARLQLELMLCGLRDRDIGHAQILADIGCNTEYGHGPIIDAVRTVVRADLTLEHNRPARIVRARIVLHVRAFLRSEKEPDEWGALDLGGYREFCRTCGWHSGCDPTPEIQACGELGRNSVIPVRRIWPLWESAPAHDPTKPRKKRTRPSV
jgi:hypothetical protein